MNVFSSSSARLLTASPIALAVLGFEDGQLSHRFRLRRLAPDAVQFRLHLASFSPGNGVEHIAPLMRLASVDKEWPKRVPRPQPAPLCFRPDQRAICRQDNGGISLVAMTNAEMNAVQVQDTPVLEASVVLAKLQIVSSGSG